MKSLKCFFLILFLLASSSIYPAKIPTKNLIDEDSLAKLIIHKSYVKAFRALPRIKVEQSKNLHYVIIYDLLNVKLKKRKIKELLCKEYNKQDPDAYTYPGLLCDLLSNYLLHGKVDAKDLHIVEEYFLKHDLKKFYLFHFARDL